MSKKVYYNNGASLMRSYARQYKDKEDNTARIASAVDNIVPRNYAAFALVLSRHYGFTQELSPILRSFTTNRSLRIWIFSRLAAMRSELICTAKSMPRSTGSLAI